MVILKGMGNELCDYKGCSREAKYELFWESYDSYGYSSEPDTNNWALSCKSHLVEIVKTHDFGPPVDDVILSGKGKYLPKLVNWINNKFE